MIAISFGISHLNAIEQERRSARLKYLRYLLIFVPIAVAAELLHWDSLIIFSCSCIALVPLAGLLGEATEELAIHTGPKIGGLLNATLGNAAELIITIVALSAGKLDLVKASITGSILGNLLLILGASLLLGGLRNGVQRFDRNLAGISATMMTLAVIGLIIPTLFEIVHEIQQGRVDIFNTNVADPALNTLSLGVAGILIVLYLFSLIFTFQTPEREGHTGFENHSQEEAAHKARWSIPMSVGVLAAST